ncbi:hypothetical protein DE146DRAFT_788609 [Phaeosphaeria sp. MPI-PUGE-AT-0046c]|nr:hypothetical protein DE146DRAFT_788609 [Phaeosphaeria sp. MPI-PUGE-AT-0046c]
MAYHALSSGSAYNATSTRILTESTTLTSTITASRSHYPPPKDIVGPIEGLDECSQTIVFEYLANSKCNPADFPCICNELKALGISGKVGAKCSKNVLDQYVRFQDDVCRGVFPPTTPSSIIITPSISNKPTPAPVVNTTTIINGTTTVPVQVTSVVVITTKRPDGKPTVAPVVPTIPIAAPPPAYTGGASAMEMGALAGMVGFMGLVFVGL